MMCENFQICLSLFNINNGIYIIMILRMSQVYNTISHSPSPRDGSYPDGSPDALREMDSGDQGGHEPSYRW